MRPISLLAATGVLLVGGATTGMVAIADDDPGKSGDRGHSEEAPGQARDNGGGHGFGPPPWAQAHGTDKAAKADRHAWKDGWKAMSEGDRKALMKQLSAEHAAGMKAFAQCAKAAQGKPVGCEKPTPPGLAKKHS